MDPRQIPVSELENKNLDRDVSPEVMTRGLCGKDTLGSWQYLQVNSSGEVILDQTTLNATYLKLDCSNSPLTGALGIEASSFYAFYVGSLPYPTLNVDTNSDIITLKGTTKFNSTAYAGQMIGRVGEAFISPSGTGMGSGYFLDDPSLPGNPVVGLERIDTGSGIMNSLSIKPQSTDLGSQLILKDNLGNNTFFVDYLNRVVIGKSTVNAWDTGWDILQLGSRSAIFANSDGNHNNQLVFVENTYWNGTNWRYIADGKATIFAMPDTGVFTWYTAPTGVAGDITAYVMAMGLSNVGLLTLPLAISTTTGLRLGGDVDLWRSNTNCLSIGDHLAVGTSGAFSPANVIAYIADSIAEGTPTFNAGTTVVGQVNAAASNWSHMAIISGTTGAAQLDLGDKDDLDIGYVSYNNNTNALTLGTNATAQVSLSSGGNLTVNNGNITASKGNIIATIGGMAALGTLAIGQASVNTSYWAKITNNLNFSAVYYYDGANYNDDTTEAATTLGTPFTLLSTYTTDYFYGINATTFTAFYLRIDTAAVGVTLVAEYSKGGGVWGTLSVTVDNTANFTTPGSITFTSPADWATDTVNGSTGYIVRLSSSTAITTPPTTYIASPSALQCAGFFSQNGDTNPTFGVYRDGRIYSNVTSPGNTPSKYFADFLYPQCRMNLRGNSQANGQLVGLYLTHVGTGSTQHKTAIVSSALNSWGKGHLYFLLDTVNDSGSCNPTDDVKIWINGTTGNTTISKNLTIDDGTAATDFTLTFDGESNDSVITWMEDEDYLAYSDDILMNTTENIYFRDTAISINSVDDGHLDLTADVLIDLNGAVSATSDLTVAGEMKGSRFQISAARATVGTADGYLTLPNGTLMTATFGYPMQRAGSIVGVSGMLNVTAVTTDGTIDVEVKKGGVTVYSVTITTAGTGDYSAYATQVRGTDTFVAGDLLQLYVNFQTFVGTITKGFAMADIQYNS